MCKSENLTIVEFFDGVTIVNMASAIATKPSKVIFIGERKLIEKQKSNYHRFVNEYGLENIEFDYKSINRNSISQIISVLEEIVQAEDNCIFDLTGGEDLVLVAMGMVFEKYHRIQPGKVKMHRFNIETGKIYDCDSDGFVPQIDRPRLTVKNNIMLYGGTIIPYDGNKSGTYPWIIDSEFELALERMWARCKRAPDDWNNLVATITIANRESGRDYHDLDFFMNKNLIKNSMPTNKKYTWSKKIGEEFCKNKIITEYVEDETCVRFRFKNEQIKLCLTKEGTLFEQIVMLFAKRAKNGNDFVYDDAMSGVCIDWDDTIHNSWDNDKDTINEIDVILTKGLIPVFISCKNGQTKDTELYKLNTVAEKFGGPYAKKVLISTNLDNNGEKDCRSLIQRAKDMDILLIKDVHKLDESEFKQVLKNIVN